MFWTRGSGKRLRGHKEAQIVALYLMSSPATTMVGIYHLALPTLCHETGLTTEEASKGLGRCIEEGFCFWDEAEELVFVPALAKHQIGEKLSAKDFKVKGVLRALAPFREHRFYAMFIDRYADSYCLSPDDSEAPSRPPPGDYVPVLSCPDQDPAQRSDAPAPAEPLALEPTPPPTKTRRRQARTVAPETEIPEGWQPTAEHVARAARDGLNLARQVDKFVSNAHAKRVLAVNWNAKFTTWLINAVEFRERDGGYQSAPAPQDPAEQRRRAQGDERVRHEAERQKREIEEQTRRDRAALLARGIDPDSGVMPSMAALAARIG